MSTVLVHWTQDLSFIYRILLKDAIMVFISELFKKVFQGRMFRAIEEDNMMRIVQTMVVPIMLVLVIFPFWWRSQALQGPALGLGHLGRCLGPPSRERSQILEQKLKYIYFLIFFLRYREKKI